MQNRINGLISSVSFLPKKLEMSSEGKDVLTVLNEHLKPVIQWRELAAPSFSLNESMINSLRLSLRTGRLIRGIESAEKKLSAERNGIVKIDRKTDSGRNERISRLAVLANDGSERFYRQANKLVEYNRPRVLAIHLDVDSFELGERLFGSGKRVLFLLISHKDAVTDFLTSLIR